MTCFRRFWLKEPRHIQKPFFRRKVLATWIVACVDSKNKNDIPTILGIKEIGVWGHTHQHAWVFHDVRRHLGSYEP